MQIERKKTGSKERTKDFEKKLGFELPTDYQEFLIENDGARISNGAFFVKELNEKVLMDKLYGVNAEGGYSIIKVNDEFGDDLAEKSLIIGKDVGGSFILLANDGENDGIYLYDHSYFFEQSSDEANTYLICQTFTEFMKTLEVTDSNT